MLCYENLKLLFKQSLIKRVSYLQLVFHNIILAICSSAILPVNAEVPRLEGRDVTSRHTHIELRYDSQDIKTANGNIRHMAIVPYTFFNLNDVYSRDEQKIGSEAYRDGVTVFDFDLKYPLYDVIQNGGRSKIPFYVEPGDTLIIQVSPSGDAISYRTSDGQNARYENMLLHDISYNRFYTEKEYREDKRDVRFPQFIDRVVNRMNATIDSVNAVADKYGFTDYERRLATNNVKLQYGAWLFDYSLPKRKENTASTSKRKGGEQIPPEQLQAISDIQNVDNYSFVRTLPLNDSLCIVSRFFPEFMDSYETSYFLTSEQHLYSGNSMYSTARKDSAFIAQDKLLTGDSRPSFFMDIALERRHFEAPSIDDGSIRLADVQVIGSSDQDTHVSISAQDMLNAKLNNKQTFDALSPTYWIEDRKASQSKKRAKKLIKQIEADEQREKEEHEAVEK